MEAVLSVPDFFNMLGGVMLILFIITIVIIFVYEYESHRGERR